MRAGAKKISMISLNLEDTEQAVALAKVIAEHSGRVVRIYDADEGLVGTVRPQPRN